MFRMSRLEIRLRYRARPHATPTMTPSPAENKHDLDVSKNSGTPKSSIWIGFSIINHPFWGTLIFGNTHFLMGQVTWHLTILRCCCGSGTRFRFGCCWCRSLVSRLRDLEVFEGCPVFRFRLGLFMAPKTRGMFLFYISWGRPRKGGKVEGKDFKMLMLVVLLSLLLLLLLLRLVVVLLLLVVVVLRNPWGAAENWNGLFAPAHMVDWNILLSIILRCDSLDRTIIG